MKFLTTDQCAAWASAQQFAFKGSPHPDDLERSGAHHIRFAIPADAGRRVVLARSLWHAMAHRPEVLLWITQWGVWESSEHMPLNDALRKAHGEARGLAATPGQLFTAGEDDAALSFLVVPLLFLWDAYLLSAGGELAIFVSHDEYCVITNRDVGEGILLEKRLASFIEPAV